MTRKLYEYGICSAGLALAMTLIFRAAERAESIVTITRAYGG